MEQAGSALPVKVNTMTPPPEHVSDDFRWDVIERLTRIETNQDNLLLLDTRVNRLEKKVAWMFGLGSALTFCLVALEVYLSAR